MKILLTGAAGQLGQALRQHRPNRVLNAGAYTAVDRAESEPELALAVNGGAPRRGPSPRPWQTPAAGCCR